MLGTVSYELPLNERMRAFLRLEFLFNQYEVAMRGTSEWDSRNAVTTLIDIFSILTLSDLKKEVLKELERQHTFLSPLRGSPGVDTSRLGDILEDIEAWSAQLRDHTGQLGQELKSNDFLISIAQRNGIPGGTCEFDLPTYHFWLRAPIEQRKADLNRWHSGIAGITAAIKLILALTRQSTVANHEVAQGGFFQKTLNKDQPCQLVRVLMPADSPFFAEISGGRHRFAIRFLEQPLPDERPITAEHDIEFQLACCTL